MATVFKKKITRPLPKGAVLFSKGGKTHARWTARGRECTAVVSGRKGAQRVCVDSGTFYARITLADGSRKDVSTGCRTRVAANAVAARLDAEQERIKAGIITENELITAGNRREPLADGRKSFIASMRAHGRTDAHIARTEAYLDKVEKTLGWHTVQEMDRRSLEKWLEGERMKGRGARVCNAYIVAWNAFGNWMLRERKVQANPFSGIRKFDLKADRRHIRRALTGDELARLIVAARNRPVLEALKGNKGRGEAMKKKMASVSPATLDSLGFLGWTRSLAYWTAAATGLRWGELRSITLGAVRLDADPAHVILQAKDEKSRRGAKIPLPSDLAGEMVQYLAERRSRLVADSGGTLMAASYTFDDVPVFNVPEKMCKVFDADLEAAGISKCDGAGCVVDIHALRHTFGTLLAKSGVSLQVAQRAMRHSTPLMTANVYTHLQLEDVSAAVEKLPKMSPALGAAARVESNPALPNVAPNVAPKSEKYWESMTIPDNTVPVTYFTTKNDTERILANNKGVFREKVGEKNGGPCRIRTCDLVIKSHLLYQLS